MLKSPVGLTIPLVAMTLVLAAQEAAPTKASKDTTLCSIEGVVTEAVGRAPISEVIVTANGPGPLVTVKTDASGNFAFRNLPPGDFRVTAQKDGYGRGASGDSSPPRRIRLLAGQRLTRIDFQLKKEAVLAGRVFDTDKNPVVGARLTVWGLAFNHGWPFFWSRASTRTNDLGEYRIPGLTEGAWYLGALNPVLDVRTRPSNARTERKTISTNARVFYPNSPSITSAEPIYLRGGEQRDGVDLVLPKKETFCVAATIFAVTVGERISVRLSEYSPGWEGVIASGSTQGSGEVEICGILQGSYYLVASTITDKGGLASFSRAFFDVMDRHVDLGRLSLDPGIQILGQVTVADAKPEDAFPTGISVGLEAKGRRFGFMGERTTAEVRAPGDFIIPNALADEYWLGCQVPSGYYVKEASMGGRDLRRESLRAGSGDLRIVLGSDGASVSGRVVDGDNQPVGDAVVVLAPARLPLAGVPGLIPTEVTDQNGQFQLASVAPGEYRLLAFTGLILGEGENPDFLRGHLTKATELNLQPRERKSVTVSVLTAH